MLRILHLVSATGLVLLGYLFLFYLRLGASFPALPRGGVGHFDSHYLCGYMILICF